MAGQQRPPDLPAPIPSGDAPLDAATATQLVALWGELRPVLQKTLRLRGWVVAVGAVIFAALIAAVTLLAFQGAHAARVANCVDTYAAHNAEVQRARARAAQRTNAALDNLVSSSIHARSPAEFHQDVIAFREAREAADRLPIPPLPPAACS